jgi:hypothetical protein
MQVKQHTNYYSALLLQGAKVVEPLKMRGETEKGKGRMWKASAKLMLGGFEYHLNAIFHGGLAETEEVASANLNIDKVVMSVEGGKEADFKEYTREGFQLLLLDDGAYVLPDKGKDARMEIRAMYPRNINTSRYVGIPTPEEVERIKELGYVKIVSWTNHIR